MRRRITEDQAARWMSAADTIRKISEMSEDLYVDFALDKNGIELTESEKAKVLKVLKSIVEGCAGWAYMFTPQSEWTGGENSVVNTPHVIDSV